MSRLVSLKGQLAKAAILCAKKQLPIVSSQQRNLVTRVNQLDLLHAHENVQISFGRLLSSTAPNFAESPSGSSSPTGSKSGLWETLTGGHQKAGNQRTDLKQARERANQTTNEGSTFDKLKSAGEKIIDAGLNAGKQEMRTTMRDNSKSPNRQQSRTASSAGGQKSRGSGSARGATSPSGSQAKSQTTNKSANKNSKRDNKRQSSSDESILFNKKQSPVMNTRSSSKRNSGTGFRSRQAKFNGSHVRHDESGQRFILDLGNGQVARVDYKIINNDQGDRTIDMFHTEVPAQLRNQGIGRELARGALEQARKANMKCKLTCDYLLGYIKKHSTDSERNTVVDC